MNTNSFVDQVKAMSDRLGDLCTDANAASRSNETLVSSAFKELGIACERLQIAAELMQRQQQELAGLEQAIAQKQQRYQDLLEIVPDAYFTTSADGIIQEANYRAADLLQIKPSLLINQPLARFITPKTQLHFQTQLDSLRRNHGCKEWQIRLQPEFGKAIDAIAIVRVSTGSPVVLRWLLRKTEPVTLMAAPSQSLDDTVPGAQSDRCPLQRFRKGDIISLDSQVIWQVEQGLVKLTTFSSNGDEVLTGLAGASAVFGSSLVASPLYQAIALTDAQLRQIPLSEVAASTTLAQSLMPHLGERLRQSDALLAVYSQQRAIDRLAALLLFLKQEIGEPVAEGTRLPVRLTHSEMAIACRTTRVTVTRMLGQLVKQKKISVDAQQHLIVK